MSVATRGLTLVTCVATLDVPRHVVEFLARHLAAHRQRLGTPKGSRALKPFRQAALVLRWFRERGCVHCLARDAGVSHATGYRYLYAGIDVIADQAPELHEVLARCRREGMTHVIMGGTMIESDRLTGVRIHALPALYKAAADGLPTLADKGYIGADIGIRIPVRRNRQDLWMDGNWRLDRRAVVRRKKYTAALLASHGYPALALGNFALPGLPATLHDIPLEHFASAARLLAAQPGTDPARVVAMGYSRGSKAALLLGEDYPALIHGAVVYSPSAQVSPGSPGGGNAWTKDSQPIAQDTIPLGQVSGPVLALAGAGDPGIRPTRRR
ncbi:hypothetical protein [Kitasatospora sp. McL0602]|uniref:hypothetical protein n=1 Tax=Kitasatospora sp. McL0602 TaxID=3439530 RepID=UPI003F8A1AF2